MMTLLLRGTFLDEITELLDDMREESVWMVLLFLCFVLLAAQTVMNMLIGVLCEVVSIVAATEKEEMMMNYVVMRLGEIMSQLNYSTDGNISKKEFVKMLGSVDATRTLQEVGVDAVGLVDFADVIFANKDDEDGEIELNFQEFMDIVLQFRGTNTATVKDVVESQKIVRNGIKNVSLQLKQLQETLQSTGNTDPTHQNDLEEMNVMAKSLNRESLRSQGGSKESTGQRSSCKSVRIESLTESEGRGSTTGFLKPLKGKRISVEGKIDSSAENHASTGVGPPNFLDTLSSQMNAIHRCVEQGHDRMRKFVSQQVDQEGQLRLSAEREASKLQRQTASLQEENRQLRDMLGTQPGTIQHLPFGTHENPKLSVYSTGAGRDIVPGSRDAELHSQPPEADSKIGSHGKLVVKAGPSIDSLSDLRGWQQSSPTRMSHARPISASSQQSLRSVEDPVDDRLEFFHAPVDRIPGALASPQVLPSPEGEQENLLPLRETGNTAVVSPSPPQTTSPTLNVEPSRKQQ